ncbi:MAG: alkyl hydroperoxide reductase [Bacteroidetes bacterium]|jgi:peroxiredoxin|nr:alkyl hydroperoxide reductase [Bacteroidota bacterium]
MQKLINALVAIAAVVTFSSCSEPEKTSGFELKGTLSNSKGEMLFLEKLTNPAPVLVDSVIVDENGNFEFKDYKPFIGFYRIKTSPQNFAMLVLDSTDKVTITGDMKDLGNTYKAVGSPETALFVEYQEITKKNKISLDSLNQAFQGAMQTVKMDSLRMDSLSKIFQAPYEAIMNGLYSQLAAKIQANTDKYASIMAIQGMDPEKYGALYKALDIGLSKRFPHDRTVRTFHEVVNKILATTSGMEAPEIDLPSPEGKNIALSSLRGKVVLIDFWASWCGPCRKEMPNVVKTYAKFKDKGFEIYGVSLDKEKDAWVQAIAKDGITWPQVSDLKFWDSDAVKLYGVSGIPYTVLLDKEGKILAKALRGAELEKAVENALAGKPVHEGEHDHAH